MVANMKIFRFIGLRYETTEVCSINGKYHSNWTGTCVVLSRLHIFFSDKKNPSILFGLNSNVPNYDDVAVNKWLQSKKCNWLTFYQSIKRQIEVDIAWKIVLFTKNWRKQLLGNRKQWLQAPATDENTSQQSNDYFAGFNIRPNTTETDFIDDTCSAFSCQTLFYLCASQFQPRASPLHIPGIWKKIFKYPALRAIFVSKCPGHVPTMIIKCPTPSPSDRYTRLFVALFNKRNCSGLIELHKTGHEISDCDWKQEKAISLIAFIGLLCSINALHLLQNDSTWLLETLDSECRRKWRQDVTKQVFCCLQMPGRLGIWQLIDLSCNKCPGFTLGGMITSGIKSHIMATIKICIKEEVK